MGRQQGESRGRDEEKVGDYFDQLLNYELYGWFWMCALRRHTDVINWMCELKRNGEGEWIHAKRKIKM